jgi:TM2 domain-containing membrane protein YozV
MDRTKAELIEELRAEYRGTIKRTAEEDRVSERTRYNTGPKSMGVAYMLWLFFGTLGGHRFYLGRISSAAIMAALSLTGTVVTFALIFHHPPSFVGALFTLPAWIWWLVDAFKIPKMVP